MLRKLRMEAAQGGSGMEATGGEALGGGTGVVGVFGVGAGHRAFDSRESLFATIPPVTDNSKVTAIIITYAPESDVLSACVESLRAQNPSPDIVIFDNFALKDPEHKVAKSFEGENCRVMVSGKNIGFGGAINEALRSVDSEFVLISNYDIVYESSYMEAAIGRLEVSAKDVVGIAGKTLFYPPDANERWVGRGPGDLFIRGSTHKHQDGVYGRHRDSVFSDGKLENGDSKCRGTGGVIDNTGTLVNGLMLAYNRGVGQIDIGQYDTCDRPMGACFAAFLARRGAFRPISKGGVGLLDSPYFMYYEDIDWCYRANILGYKILYEPGAVAWHHHSLTTRDRSIFFKYHLIQRNLYRTIMKNMRFRTVIRLWAFHARMHLRRARVEKEFGAVTAKILFETLAWAVTGLFKRVPIQPRRKFTDTEIVNLSIGEEGHLDDIALEPKADWHNPLASLKRLESRFPDDPACELIPLIEKLADGNAGRDVGEKAIELARDKCPVLVPLLSRIVEISF